MDIKDSLISLMLFNIYIGELVRSLKVDMFDYLTYADDSHLYRNDWGDTAIEILSSTSPHKKSPENLRLLSDVASGSGMSAFLDLNEVITKL